MIKERTLILDKTQVKQKIERIAHEIYENNFKEEKIIIVGIHARGQEFAKQIVAILNKVGDLTIEHYELEQDKDHPLDSIPTLSTELSSLKDCSVILIDDVLNSGKTLMYAANYLLSVSLKKLTTVVLVDRRHRRFPIKADFVGLTLSTTLQEHISVEFDGNEANVYLQ